MLSLGIDIGGTAIKAALVDPEGNLFEKKVELTEGNKMKTLQSLVVKYLESFEKDIISIGVGTAGRVDAKGEIKLATANIENWTRAPIKSNLEKLAGKPVTVINDANAAAYGEWILHYGTLESLFLITIGTGLGGGFVYKGEIVAGHRGEAGEIGHIILRENGTPCNCGKKGCAEQYISMKWLHNRAVEKTGKTLEREELLKRFENGDLSVRKAVDELCSELARVVDTIMFLFDPVKVVIGGGIAELGLGFLKTLRKSLKLYAEKGLYLPEDVTLANALNDAGIIGAALYSMSKLGSK